MVADVVSSTGGAVAQVCIRGDGPQGVRPDACQPHVHGVALPALGAAVRQDQEEERLRRELQVRTARLSHRQAGQALVDPVESQGKQTLTLLPMVHSYRIYVGCRHVQEGAHVQRWSGGVRQLEGSRAEPH